MVFQRSDQPLTAMILILPDASLMSVAATLDPMRAANRVSAGPRRRHHGTASGQPAVDP